MIIGYKKCIYFNRIGKTVKPELCIVELEIPDDARVVIPQVGSMAHKLRCDKAVVKAIFSLDALGKSNKLPDDTVAFSIISLSYFVDHLRNNRIMLDVFKYVVSETVTPEYSLDTYEYHACGSGIHFFLAFDLACKYSELDSYIKDIDCVFNDFYGYNTAQH